MSADARMRFAPLAALFLAGIALVVFKLCAFGVAPNSDYYSYLETAAFFRGEAGAQVFPNRILKPLEPLMIAAEESVLSPEHAFVVQIVFFYFLLLGACYFFGRAFGFSRAESALAGLFIGGSYPVLRYGLDLYTETGALFFYILALTLTLLYLRAPARRILYANIAVVTIGALWKEYSIVAGAVFGFAILFHPQLSWRARFAALAAYAGIFLAINLAWQAYVYRVYDYSYFSFYAEDGAPGYYEFTFKNVAKSLAALLGLAWLLVPFGLARWRALEAWQRRFFMFAIPLSAMAFLWGFVSSRLYFVIAPAFVLLALLSLARVRSPLARSALVALVLAANLAWLALSFRITL
ncbi:MAG TPA: hypothetical protein VHC68_02940 [Candidatus Paceibacterota bacterium]|nr:hypothetical protein [Candidatus Paceibacterota bacterium]